MNASAPIPASFAFRLRLLACTGALSVCATAALAQAPASGDYTAALPSVQRVETEIHGTDPTDTLARQVAVFEYLQTYIQRIKETRDYRGPYTPGEQKLRTDYARAQYDLTQSYTKSHTPQELSAFNQLEGKYSTDNAIGWVKQLQGQQAADAYAGAEDNLAQSARRNQERIQQSSKPQQSGGFANDPVLDPTGMIAAGQKKMENDPRTRRCLELGGTVDACEGTENVGALAGLLTSFMGGSDSTAPPPLTGVLLVGQYHSRTDLPEIALTAAGGAVIQKCGTLVEDSRPYTLRKSGATTQLVVDNEPNPIVLTLRPDGLLSGPGNIALKGRIISGYHNVSTCTTGTLAARCATTSTPIYAASMQRCTLTQLAPQPAPPPPPKETGVMGQIGDMMGMGDPVATLYGFRVTGPYASSTGMQLSFENRYVTLDCGKAHVNVPYTVDNTATGFMIHIQNGAGPFLLAVAPDNTLRGAGSTTVNGRLVTSINGDNVSFTPHSENCAVSTFAPRSNQNTMRTSNQPMPASYPAPR